jgi:hypothetical protein
MQSINIHAAAATVSGSGSFDANAYGGGKLRLGNWDFPVVVDLSGLENGKTMVANLDHVQTQRVGVVTSVVNTGRTLRLKGNLSAATEARREVVESAKRGYVWEVSIEVNPTKVDFIERGERVQANGQSFDGPVYVARRGTLKGVAFVSHGADENTSVSIAASAGRFHSRRREPNHVTFSDRAITKMLSWGTK